MGWSVGYDDNWKRDIGYGIPAMCDHPGCGERIDRGLAYVCCNQEPYGGEDGCGLFFCGKHLAHYKKDGEWTVAMCESCAEGNEPFEPTPDLQEWIDHKETCPTWAEWRAERDSIMEGS